MNGTLSSPENVGLPQFPCRSGCGHPLLQATDHRSEYRQLLALSFLLVVLFTAAYSGIGPAILAALASMLCFNFFFLEPVGTFTIHDPQNWVALFAFLVTAIIASQLSSAARNALVKPRRATSRFGSSIN